MVLFCFVYFFRQYWGISSNGRAPALHAGGTGIDARILHPFFFLFSPLRSKFACSFEVKIKKWIMWQLPFLTPATRLF